MFPVIGIVVVLGCIAGGYLMEKGNLLVLMQPAELLIIAGCGNRDGSDRESALRVESDRRGRSPGL